MNPELSIIVPVYKTEAYVSRCLDSILAQTFGDFELLITDDGSPDSSGAICDECALQDTRILVTHQPNSGVSAARNKGLDLACGEYLGFVDSDDWIEQEMYEHLIDALEGTSFCIATSAISVFDNDGNWTRHSHLSEFQDTSAEGMLERFLRQPNPYGGCVCNKVFCRREVKGVRFLEGMRIGEDQLYLFQCMENSSGSIKISRPLYCCRESQGSATRSNTIGFAIEAIEASECIYFQSCTHAPKIRKQAFARYVDDCIRYTEMIRRCSSMPLEASEAVNEVKRRSRRILVKAVAKNSLTRKALHRYVREMR